METKDCNGNLLQNGDAVIVNKTLDVKGSPLVIKKGTTESTSTYSVPLKSIVRHASCHETTRRTSSI